jgi:hypothetical protein
MALTLSRRTSALKRLGKLGGAGRDRATRGRRCAGTTNDLRPRDRYSARNEAEWDRLIGALDAFEAIQTTSAHIRRALQVQRLLATQSQRGRKIQTCSWPQPQKNMT